MPDTFDPVDRPAHYTFGSREVVDVVEEWISGGHLDAATAFEVGSVLQYLARAGRKGSALEDLRKAEWYLRRAIGRLERDGEETFELTPAAVELLAGDERLRAGDPVVVENRGEGPRVYRARLSPDELEAIDREAERLFVWRPGFRVTSIEDAPPAPGSGFYEIPDENEEGTPV